MSPVLNRKDMRQIRHLRIRTKVQGRTEMPRLNVYRSLQHIYAQVIDDGAGCTLAAASSLKLPDGNAKLPKLQVAKLVGAEIAQRAKAAGVTHVVFDRGGYKYHGRVKALADAAREGGLLF